MADFRKTLRSDDGERSAVVILRPDGRFFVSFQAYADTTVAATGGLGDPFWRVARDGILRDTEAAAIEAAERWIRGEDVDA